MKRMISVLILSLFSFNALAEEAPVDKAPIDKAPVEKPFSVGAGFYRSVLDSDDFIDEIEFTGIAFTFGYAFSNQFAFRGTYFNLDEVDLSVLESEGFDFNLYLGTGFANQGFKGYVGGGLFKDEFSVGSDTETFSGLQLSGGVGYNWESLSVDFVLNIRDSSDYEDFINEQLPIEADVSVVTGSLLLSLRF